MTAEMLLNDASTINKFISEACATQMAEYNQDMLNGKQTDSFELLWKSAPDAEHDLCVAMTVQEVSLFVQDQKPQEAIVQLGSIRSLINVCRDKWELLSTAPVVLRVLLSRVFVHGFVCEQSEQTVQFLAENQLLAPDLLGYTTLDEIASICFKYGNATPVHLQVRLTVVIDAIFSCFL